MGRGGGTTSLEVGLTGMLEVLALLKGGAKVSTPVGAKSLPCSFVCVCVCVFVFFVWGGGRKMFQARDFPSLWPPLSILNDQSFREKKLHVYSAGVLTTGIHQARPPC